MLRLLCLLLSALLTEEPDFHVQGKVLDIEEQPVAGATVWLVQGLNTHRTASADDGGFYFAIAKPGPTTLVVRKEGYSIAAMNFPLLGPVDTIECWLGEAMETTLRVVGSTFQPVEGAQVKDLFINDIYIPVMDLVDHGYPSLRSDESGLLVIDAIPVDVQIGCVLVHHRFADTHIPIIPIRDKPDTVQMYSGVPIHGRVIDDEGKGIEHAQIMLYYAGDDGARIPQRTESGPDGMFRFIARSGKYIAVGLHTDYAPSRPVEAPVARILDTHIEIILPSSHTVEGVILGPGDEPFGGVWVNYVLDGLLHQQTMSLYDGTYQLKVAAGNGSLHIQPPEGFILAEQVDLIVQIEDAPLTRVQPVHLTEMPELPFYVVGPEGTPESRVLISSKDIRPPFWVLPDEEGHFTIFLRNMPIDGKIKMTAEHGIRFWRTEFTVDVNNPTEQQIKLREFEPDLRANDPERVSNTLEGMLDRRPPEIACSHWVNTEPLSLQDLRGKIVVLTFWAGFESTGPSFTRVEELRVLHALYKDNDDVVFVGVLGGLLQEELDFYVKQREIEFPVGLDNEYGTTFDRFNTVTVPQTFLLDREGVVKYYDVDGRLLELIKVLLRRG